MRTFLKSLIVAALTAEARAVLRKYRPRIIAVTGSVGKTSTKDAIYAALAATMYVRRSEKSFNSEIGLPLTILGRPNAWDNPLRWIQNLIDGLLLILFRVKYPQWLVLEVGADRPNDIRSIASWLPIDIAVITRLPEVPVHVEYFSSPEEVIEEKASLISALKPSGTLILYGDDERVRTLASRTKTPVLTFGITTAADIKGSMLEFFFGADERPSGMRAEVQIGDEKATISITGAVGSYSFMPVLAACAVGKALAMNLQDIGASIEKKYVPPPGRMRLIPGINTTLIIDDTYNSSPAAVAGALETLHSIPMKGRRIAILGDMLELGKYSADEHRKAGEIAARCADILVTAGVRAQSMADAALAAGLPTASVMQFNDSLQAGKIMSARVQPGDCILVKGSQSIRMERVVEALMENPKNAPKLLVRQEKEWRDKK